MTNELLTSAAAERNKDPILTVLETVLPATGSVLEIASGTGQHVCFFAAELPGIRWQPTEPDAPHREAIAARIREAGLTNVAAPIALDVHEPRWPVAAQLRRRAVHQHDPHLALVAPPTRCASAPRATCAPRGKLVLYGPYLENGTAVQSNLDFDATLKRRNPEWGLRELEEVTRVAALHGLQRQQVVRMPANNLTVVFSKSL